MAPLKQDMPVCCMCGTTRRKLPRDWINNNCLFYCAGCWVTVRCDSCDHHDPKGLIFQGRWTCRSCHHQRCIASRSPEKQHEALHRAIIEDENGEVSLDSSSDMANASLDFAANEGFEGASTSDLDEDSIVSGELDDSVAPLAPRPAFAVAAPRGDLSPGHLVLLLDTSGSMRMADVLSEGPSAKASNDYVTRLDAAVTCALRFIRAHARDRPRDVFSLAAFGDAGEVVAEVVDACGMEEALTSLCLRGKNGTFYGAALRSAVQLLSHRPSTPSHVVMLSDGRPADTKVALEFFKREFMRGEHRGTRVHAIGFGTSVLSFAPLQQFACLTGGAFALAGCSVQGLCNAFSSVSSTITSVSTNSAQGERGGQGLFRVERSVDFELPEMGVFGKRGTLSFRATRSSFRYDGSSFHEQSWNAGQVVRRTVPYMRGGMRLVYGFQDKDVVSEEDGWMVAKCSRFLDEVVNSRTIVEAHAKSTAIARYFAARFNDHVRDNVAAKIFFVPCFTYEFKDAEKPLAEGEPRFFSGERYLPGAFLKYNSNNGYVCEEFFRHQSDAQAFLHFTFVASRGTLLVSDLQGVARERELLLTDPQVLTPEGLYGPGDIGARGMRACLAAHRCGPTCRSLGLKPVNSSLLRQLQETSASHRRLDGRRRAGPSGGDGTSEVSAGWEKVSEPSLASDWDRVSERGPMEYAMSDGQKSSHASESSWAMLDM